MYFGKTVLIGTTYLIPLKSVGSSIKIYKDMTVHSLNDVYTGKDMTVHSLNDVYTGN